MRKRSSWKNSKLEARNSKKNQIMNVEGNSEALIVYGNQFGIFAFNENIQSDRCDEWNFYGWDGSGLL